MFQIFHLRARDELTYFTTALLLAEIAKLLGLLKFLI